MVVLDLLSEHGGIMTAIAEATYQKINGEDDWYIVILNDQAIGQTYRTKKGYFGFCANAPKVRLGPTRKKEELAQLLLAKWEAFPIQPPLWSLTGRQHALKAPQGHRHND